MAQSYDEILADCEENDKVFEDPLFPADRSSILGDDIKWLETHEEKEIVEWKRV